MVVRNVVTYVLLIAAAVAGIRLTERLVAGAASRRGGAGAVPALDAEYDFDRLWAQHRRQLLLARLLGQPRRLALPVLADSALSRGRRHVGELTIPLDRVVGSVDGGAGLFDRDFRPATPRARARLQGVLAALRSGEVLPPIEVYRVGRDYYVYDGHHRVAAARALGHDYIAAIVTDLDTAAGRQVSSNTP